MKYFYENIFKKRFDFYKKKQKCLFRNVDDFFLCMIYFLCIVAFYLSWTLNIFCNFLFQMAVKLAVTSAAIPYLNQSSIQEYSRWEMVFYCIVRRIQCEFLVVWTKFLLLWALEMLRIKPVRLWRCKKGLPVIPRRFRNKNLRPRSNQKAKMPQI